MPGWGPTKLAIGNLVRAKKRSRARFLLEVDFEAPHKTDVKQTLNLAFYGMEMLLI